MISPSRYGALLSSQNLTLRRFSFRCVTWKFAKLCRTIRANCTALCTSARKRSTAIFVAFLRDEDSNTSEVQSMSLKDIKDRLTRAVETENPPGTDYYGAEMDEDEVEAARERMDESVQKHEDAMGKDEPHTTPTERSQTR